jgi:hypothetical protein
MISFGPNIRGAHSPDETVQVSSVQKFWRYLAGDPEADSPEVGREASRCGWLAAG